MLSDKNGNVVTEPCYAYGFVKLFGDVDSKAARSFTSTFNVIIDDPDFVQFYNALIFDEDRINKALKDIEPYIKAGEIHIFIPFNCAKILKYDFEPDENWHKYKLMIDESPKLYLKDIYNDDSR